MLHAVETLYGKLTDTYFAAGSEAYAAALLVYQYAKLHHVATGALEDSLDDLGRRFARKSNKNNRGQTPIFATASTTEEPDAGKLHVRNFAVGAE